MRDPVTSPDAAIHLGEVSKEFGKAGADATYRAVDGLNLDVRPGQMLAPCLANGRPCGRCAGG